MGPLVGRAKTRGPILLGGRTEPQPLADPVRPIGTQQLINGLKALARGGSQAPGNPKGRSTIPRAQTPATFPHGCPPDLPLTCIADVPYRGAQPPVNGHPDDLNPDYNFGGQYGRMDPDDPRDIDVKWLPYRCTYPTQRGQGMCRFVAPNGANQDGVGVITAPTAYGPLPVRPAPFTIKLDSPPPGVDQSFVKAARRGIKTVPSARGY